MRRIKNEKFRERETEELNQKIIGVEKMMGTSEEGIRRIMETLSEEEKLHYSKLQWGIAIIKSGLALAMESLLLADIKKFSDSHPGLLEKPIIDFLERVKIKEDGVVTIRIKKGELPPDVKAREVIEKKEKK